jgi:hypothetical protein
MSLPNREPGDETPDEDDVDAVQFVFIPQETVSLYEVRDSVGDLVTLLIAEGRDDPARFNARPDAEKDAMKILALDEYYGSSVWEGPSVI